MKRYWLVGLALALVPTVALSRAERLAAPPSDAAETSCEEASSGAETLGCYRDAAKRSHADVEHAFAQRVESARAFDKQANDFGRRHHMAHSVRVAQLRASQAAWIKYSKSQCAFEAGSAFNGSGADILDAACHQRLNLARLSELKTPESR